MGGVISTTYGADGKKLDVADKYFPKFVETIPKQDSKVIIITGCTTGTGFTAAKVAAQKGATVLLLNRKSERAALALESLMKEGKVEHVDCDLQSFYSVRAAAKLINEKYADIGIDILCLNAGGNSSYLSLSSSLHRTLQPSLLSLPRSHGASLSLTFSPSNFTTLSPFTFTRTLAVMVHLYSL
jgi:NAD(P)-dependent dehydrogenase (short-subunit alcohol dehydrogenase family)